MMLTSKTLLRSLTSARVTQLAWHFDINASGMTKKKLITRIALSLANRSDDEGNTVGRMGAAKLLCAEMTRAEVLKLLRETEFYGAEFVYSSTSALHSLTADKARQLLMELAGAEKDTDLDETCRVRRWSEYFHAEEYEEDDTEDMELEGADGDAEEDGDAPEEDGSELEFEEADEEPEWLNALSFEAGPDRELPEGLTRTNRSLFEHQQRSVAALLKWWRGDKDKGVLCLPTGAGKTRTAVHFVLEHVLAEGGKVLWLAHRHELVNQAVAAFLQNGESAATNFRIGRFEAGARKFEEPAEVVVASVPTLARAGNVDKLLTIHGSFSLIIVDECHHAVAQSWKRLLQELESGIEGEKLLGLSATPTRTAEGEVRQLWKLFGDIIHEEALLPLMERGILARPRVVMVPTHQTFMAGGEERRLFAKFKDLPPALVRRIAEDEERNSLIVETVVKNAETWGQTLIFAATLAHAQDLVDRLLAADLDAAKLDCGSSREERLAVIERFKAKNLPVLVNVGLFTEGTDLPGVQTVLLARPTLSRILFQQMVGRGLRGPALGGTADCNVVAIYDEVLGLVQDQLTSSFSSERSALAAITGEADADLTGSGTDAEEDDRETHDARPAEQRMQELVAALRAITSKGEEVDTNALRLVGWWQAGDDGALRALPVFEDVLEGCGAFVARVLHESHASTPPSEPKTEGLRVPEPVVHAFVDAIRRAPGSTRYFSVVGSEREDWRRLAQAVQLIGAAPREESPLLTRARWLNSPERASKVLLPMHGQSVDVNRRDYEAVEAIWRQMGSMLLGPSPDAPAIDRFVTGVLAARERFPEMTDVPRGIAESLIRAAAANGGNMPGPVADEDLSARPPLPDIRKELGTLAGEFRAQALRDYHQAFFKTQQPDYADFVTSLLCD